MNSHKPMTVKMFSSTIGGGGGVSQYISNLTSALRARGHKVTLIQPIHAGMNKSFKVAAYNALGIHLAKSEPNCVIHSHEADGALLLTKNAHVMTIHGVVADEIKYFHKLAERTSIRFASMMEAVSCRRADRCTAVSDFSREKAAHLYQLNRSNIQIIHPCVDTERFKPVPSYSNARNVLFVGRIYKRKGLDTLLQALALIRNERLTLRVIGSGPEQNRIEELIKNLDLKERVTLLGEISSAQLLENYQKSDVVCIPSHQEGFSIVAIEAQACGVPVVGMHVGGLPEAVEDSKLLAQKGSIEALSQILLKTVTEASEARRRRCRQFVLTNFAPEIIASKMETVYRQALDRDEND